MADDPLTGLVWTDIPAHVRERVQWLVRDAVAVCAAGAAAPVTALAADHVADAHGPGSSTVLYDGRRTTVPGAAFANGVAADALCFTDGHVLARGHPGSNVIPAALAVAEDRDATVERFLAAVALGLEVAIRSGIDRYARDPAVHGAGTWGASGAAVAAAVLHGGDRETVVRALGVAEYSAPIAPLLHSVAHPTMCKDAIGWGASAGAGAAMLARRGFTAPPSELLASGRLDSLGEEWLAAGTYVKRFPVCRWSQPALKATLALRAEHGFGPSDVDRIRVRTFTAATRLASGTPASSEEAQYSVVWPVAYAVAHGRFGPDAVLGGIGDPAATALLPRISLVVDGELDALYPARRVSVVEVHTVDGRVLDSGPVEADGEHDDPSWADIVAEKFAGFVGPAGPPSADTLQRRLGGLSRAELVAAICG